ncbi:MAG: hypothetical protein U1F21_03100 [Sphaerotilus natans]
MTRLAVRLVPLTAALLLALPAAQAETSPWYIGASQAFTRNSNVFYAPDDRALSDTISTTGVRLGLDQPISRQRLSASVSANSNRYSSLDYLNHTDYSLDTKLDLETVEHISGQISFQAAQSLPKDQNLYSTGERNLLTTRALNARGQIGLGSTMWSFDAGAATNQIRYSASNYKGNNYDQSSVNAGLRYRPASGLTLGASLRRGKVDYVDSGVKLDRNDLDLLAWASDGGASSYDARLSMTRSESLQSNRTNRTWTGTAGWTWKPTGKLSTALRLTRDNSDASYDYALGSLSINGGNRTEISTTLSLNANWQATSKISVGGNLAYARRSLDQTFLTVVGIVPVSASDRTTSLGLNISYELMRNIDLGCGVTWANRSASDATQLLTRQFKVTTYSCSGQIYLR